MTIIHFCPQKKLYSCKLIIVSNILKAKESPRVTFARTKRVSQAYFTDQDFLINIIMSYLEIKIFFHKLVDFEKQLVTFSLFNFCLYISRNDPWIVKNCTLAKVEIEVFLHITWSHDQKVTWLGGWDTLTLNHKGYSKSNRTKWRKYRCITNWGKLVLQIGAALFFYKLGQKLLQIGAAIKNSGNRHYKMRQLFQIGAKCITNWGRYYKLGQLLQIRAWVLSLLIQFEWYVQ